MKLTKSSGPTKMAGILGETPLTTPVTPAAAAGGLFQPQADESSSDGMETETSPSVVPKITPDPLGMKFKAPNSRERKREREKEREKERKRERKREREKEREKERERERKRERKREREIERERERE